MTSPQNELCRLTQRIEDLTNMFESDENGDNIFDMITRIEEMQEDLMSSQQKLENLMNLIITLLNRDTGA